MSAATRPPRSRSAPPPLAVPAWVYVAVVLSLAVAALAFGYVLLDSTA